MDGPVPGLRRLISPLYLGPVPGLRRLIEADGGRLIAKRTQFSVGWRMIAYPH